MRKEDRLSDTTRTRGRVTLPASQKLRNVTVALMPDTILWLQTTYPGQASVFVRGLVEEAKHREEMAAKKART